MKTKDFISLVGIMNKICMFSCFVILFCVSEVSAQDLPGVLREKATIYWEEGNSHLGRRDPVAAREAFHKALAALNIKVEIQKSGRTNYDIDIDPFATDQEMAGIILQRMEQLERVIAYNKMPAIYPREIHVLNAVAASSASITLLENVRARISFLSLDSKLRIGKLLRESYNGAIHWADILQLMQNNSNKQGIKTSLPDLPYNNLAFLYADRSRSRLILDLFDGIDQIGSDRLLREWYIRMSITDFLTWARETALQESARDEPFHVKVDEELFNKRHGLLQAETEKLYAVQKVINGQRPRLIDNLQILPAKNINFSEIQQNLDHREAIIEYHFTESDLYIFVIKSSGNVVLEVAERQAKKIKRTAEKYAGILSSAKKRPWKRESKRLYSDLIKPIRQAIIGMDRLIIVPSDALHAVTFQTLMDPETGGVLLDDYVIRYLPVASLLKRSVNKSNHNGKAMIVAIKNFSKNVPSLEHSEDEARSIKRFWGSNADLFLESNDNVNKSSLLPQLNNYEFIHISTHGKYDLNDPILSYLILKSPGGVDAKMSAYEFLVHPLSARLITLSACETYFRAGADISTGEDIFGLPQTLLLAGARNVLASMWQVKEVPTSELMNQFYSYIMAPDPYAVDEALRKAQINLKEKYAHPYNWAPFVLYGYSD